MQLAVGLAGATAGFILSGGNPLGAYIGWTAAAPAWGLLGPADVAVRDDEADR